MDISAEGLSGSCEQVRKSEDHSWETCESERKFHLVNYDHLKNESSYADSENIQTELHVCETW